MKRRRRRFAKLPATQNCHCKKLGKQFEAGISYHLLTDLDHHYLYLAVTGNNARTGYFSREVIPFRQVEKSLDKGLESDKPFPSKLFKDAFIGRSINNTGFIAAILRHKGLHTSAHEVETGHNSLIVPRNGCILHTRC